jgi:two-component system, chemotaxis family, sensor kinase CheA
MDNFRKKFIEEALEHINDLESALLQLETAPDDKELIERVFRSMHSLKGGGAMFGFDKISEFTHNLETVYDMVRNGQMKITRDLLNITLSSVDHLKNLLNQDNELVGVVKINHTQLSEQIARIISGEKDERQKIDEIEVKPEEISKTGEATFYILFSPAENIFDNGTNPLYLIDELCSLGKAFVIPHFKKIPVLSGYNPEKCYISWEIFLATDQDINAITDVFIFVEDSCKLDIHRISDRNLLDSERFMAKVREMHLSGSDWGINAIQHFVSQLITVQKKEKDKTVQKKNIYTNSKDSNISSIRVSSAKLDQLMNLVSELVTTQARLSLYAENDGNSELIAIAENVQKLSRQLRDNAFSIVLIPIENMITRFQRLVRDLSNELKKEVVFITEGTDTELDKTIIENLTDPIMHILRNSMDHGIETADVRKKLEKPAQGTITLKAFYSGANVHIQIHDDGAGIDPDKIRKKAIAKGIIAPDTVLSRKEVYDLIFMPGFSTATNITDVSGRGVGMDVVRRKIADIRGEVEVDSNVNVGTTITLKLPLTLSIIDGLLVKIEDTFYIIPLSAVEKIYAVEHEKLVDTFNHLVVLDGIQVPFFNLREEFEIEQHTNGLDQVVVVKYEDQRVGFVVDGVVGEYQAVLKPLGKHYKRQEIISGATILGDGTVALVFDTNKAVKYFSNLNVITEDAK